MPLLREMCLLATASHLYWLIRLNPSSVESFGLVIFIFRQGWCSCQSRSVGTLGQEGVRSVLVGFHARGCNFHLSLCEMFCAAKVRTPKLPIKNEFGQAEVTGNI